jgi:hypothetical protein
MIIEESDFKLEGDLDRFDLYLIKVINAKDPVKRREELTLVGYGMHLENCLKKIIMYRLARKQDVYTLKEFYKGYIEEAKFLKALLNDPIS